MRRIYFIFLIILILNTQTFGKIWIINNTGETFVPAEITINLGDTVKFVIETSHQVREVSQTTWQNNSNTALAGGFSTSFGGGLILPAQLSLGIHYYVCVPHASGGMKGTIIVQGVTGIGVEKYHASLSVFPNPAKNIINIQTNKSFHESIFSLKDLTGRQILIGKLNDELTSVDIENLPKGIYLLIIGKSQMQYRKIIKE